MHESVYQNISAAQYAALCTRANAQGVPISGDHGKATRSGVTLEWVYDPGTGTLTVTCDGKPIFVGLGEVWGELDKLVGKAGVRESKPETATPAAAAEQPPEKDENGHA